MSVETVMARITELQQGLVAPSTAAPVSTDASAFQSALQGAATGTAATATAAPAAGATALSGVTTPAAQSAGQRALQFAEGEIGQTEQPPGSNDSPRIAEYRTATAG